MNKAAVTAALLAFVTVLSGQQPAMDIRQRLALALGREDGGRATTLLAEKRYIEIEPMLPPTGEGLALCGVLEFLNGRMAGAVKFFEEARAKGELSETDDFTLSMAFVKLGQDDQARSELLRLPAKALYLYWLGRIDYDQRRYAAAVEKLKRATELDAANARAWDGLGLAYDMQGQAEEALKAFETGARVNREQASGSAWPPHDLGVLLLRTGETKRAEAAFREALSYDAQMEQAHYHLGRALEKEGSDQEALKEYQIAIAEDRTAADVCYSLAQLYRKLGRDQEANAMFTNWRKLRGPQP